MSRNTLPRESKYQRKDSFTEKAFFGGEKRWKKRLRATVVALAMKKWGKNGRSSSSPALKNLKTYENLKNCAMCGSTNLLTRFNSTEWYPVDSGSPVSIASARNAVFVIEKYLK